MSESDEQIPGWRESKQLALALQRERLVVLVALYELQGGDERRDVTWSAVIGRTKLTDQDLQRPWLYLVAEHLVHGQQASRVAISHKGIVELERALTRPDEPTEHFPAPMVYFANVGAVQLGADAIATVEQTQA